MKNFLRPHTGPLNMVGYSGTLASRPYRLHSTQYLLTGLLLSLSTLGWGQCFNTSTVTLGYTTAPTSNSPASQAVGDFNGDGKPDLAIISLSSNTIGILLNAGNGTFGSTTSYTAGTAPRTIATADLNGDGKLDLVVTNASSDNVSVLLNTGGGSFSTATSFVTGDNPSAVAIGDFNGDGKPDLATANRTANNVSILLNVGGGSFGGPNNFAVGTDPISLVAGDFNSDGKTDLAVANRVSGNVSILQGNGLGGFGPATSVGTIINPVKIVTGDFNGDSRPDLAVFTSFAFAPVYGISILLGNGSGGFGASPNINLGSSITSDLASGDFNGDGKADLATANLSTNNVSVFLSKGDGSFGTATTFATGMLPTAVAVGDFNSDGKPDLTVSNGNDATISVLTGNGDGTFGTSGPPKNPIFVATADFNADGKADMAVANFNTNNVSIMLANNSGGFGAATSFAVGTNPTSIAVGDLNGDGRPDLVITNQGSNSVSVRLGNGSGGFGMAPDVAVGEMPHSVVITDYNGDGKLDFVTANIGENISTSPPDNINTQSYAPGDGNGGFGTVNSPDDGIPYNGVAVGDFDADGKADLVFVSSTSNYSITILLQGKNYYSISFPSHPGAVVTGDFNRDGKLDLATANLVGDNISVLPGDGTGKFGTPVNYSVGISPASIVAGDFNGDGKLDLATANSGGNNTSVLLGNGSGGFATTNFTVGTMPTSVAVGDFNGDGKPDLVTANRGSNDVTVLMNCNVAANTPPSVANAIPNQSGTVGQAFAYTIPANTFSDTETPGNLVLSATGLPAGLSLTGSTISGTPSASGVSTVTIKATDPGSLFVNATFTITISPAGSPPPPPAPGSLTITNFTCNYTGATLSSVNFVVGYNGGTFTPALPNLFINGVTITGQLGQTYSFGFDANQSLLPVQDNATRSTYFVWNFRDACAGSVTPPLAMAPLAPSLPNQTATQSSLFNYVVPAFGGTAPITYAASGLPAGLSFNAATRTISGTPTGTGVSTVMITATNAAGMSSGSFTITVNAPVTPPSTPGSLTITNFTCNYTGAALSSVNFVVGYSGGTFTPALPNLFINGVTITGQLGQTYTFGFDGNQSLLPIQDQASRSTYFIWNFRAACGGSSVRLGAEPVTPWQAQLLGNPVSHEVAVSVSGAQGQSLQLELTNLAGLVVETRRIQPTSAGHKEVFDVQRQPGGLLLLQVTGDDHRQTLKILKQ